MPTPKAIRFRVNTYPICRLVEIGAAQLPSVQSLTEIAPKSPFLCVNRNPIWYGFRAGAKAIQYSIKTYLICDSPL